MPEDWINVRDIRAFGHHGVTTLERTHGQVFEADVALCLDLTEASRSDRLSDTVDYAEVCRRVAQILGGEPHRLLESIAGRVAEEMLSAFPRVERVVVILRKPSVARTFRADAVEVELKRSRVAKNIGRQGV